MNVIKNNLGYIVMALAFGGIGLAMYEQSSFIFVTALMVFAVGAYTQVRKIIF